MTVSQAINNLHDFHTEPFITITKVMSIEPSFIARLKTDISLTLVRAITLVFNKLAPNWTYKKVEDLLLVPKSKKVIKTKVPHGISLFNIETKEGTLQAYQLGHGPTVVFVHGWSGGAHQFFPLMNGLSKCGFRTLAFDHFAHGHSEGKHASLLRFTSAVNAVLQYVNKNSNEGLAGIVGHSMGCIAIANARPKLIKDVPLLLISPVFNFKKYFRKQLNFSGLHPDLLKKHLYKFETSYMRDVDKMELNLKLRDYSSSTAIVHDKMDEESDYVDSVKFCAVYPLTNLIVTREYGHNRILNSETAWQQLKSHLNYEDITTSTNF